MDRNTLFPEIFLRCSARTLGTCICVSRTWAKMIHDPIFRKDYQRSSYRRRRILYAVPHFRSQDDIGWNFYKSRIEKSGTIKPDAASQIRAETFDMSKYYRQRPESVNGLICSDDRPIICDPSTGSLKRVSAPVQMKVPVRYMLGYCPDDDSYKILSMWGDEDKPMTEYRVCTLGAANEGWRTVSGGRSASILTNATCFGGNIYFIANTHGEGEAEQKLVQFSLRTETLRFLKYTCELVVAEGKNLEEAAAWRTITFSFVTLPDFDNYCVIGTTLEPDQIIFQGWDNKVSRFCLFFVNLTTGACSMAPVHGLEPPRIRLDKHKVMAFDHADSMAFLN
uniref:Putative F-box protein n=1 Tax=Noccaea caerulescens TaxID=107243 RepID=A0A1J3GTW6_NOCCA